MKMMKMEIIPMNESELKLEVSKLVNELKFKYSKYGENSDERIKNDIVLINELALLKFLNLALTTKPQKNKIVSQDELFNYIKDNFNELEIKDMMKKSALEACGLYGNL